MNKTTFTANVVTELKRHGSEYGYSLRNLTFIVIAFALVKDAEILDLSWWWMLLPALRAVGLLIFITYVGLTGDRD